MTGSTRPPLVWCVGGSDVSSHAGLQADLRTGQDLNCHVQTIVSCITAQNSMEVLQVDPVSLSMFDAQWQSLLEDALPDAVKVGLLPTNDLVKACADWLRRLKTKKANVLVVFDPVMGASQKESARLQVMSSCELLASGLLLWVDLITPNLPELTQFIRFREGESISKLHSLLTPLLKDFSTRWLVKGGHARQRFATDWLFSLKQKTGFSCPMVEAKNTRGTGCTLSTAIASFSAHGYELLDAITLAKSYLTSALKSGIQIGKGAGPLGCPGWPLSYDHLPKIHDSEESIGKLHFPFADICAETLGLYPVMDSPEWLALVLSQGIKTAQIRIKDPYDPQLDDKLKQAVELGRQYQAKVFINDYWQKAIEFGAYGVHLGQEDLDTVDLSALKRAGLRLGVSTHGYYEIARVKSIQPSYVALGHIFPTQTKEMPSKPQGIKRLKDYVSLLEGRYPTVAIGGISAERVLPVLETGVDSVALVTAITHAPDSKIAIRNLMDLVTRGAKVEQGELSSKEKAS